MDHRILRFRDDFATMKAGGVTMPQMVTVFPTYGCNFACEGCHYSRENQAEAVFVDVDRLLARLDEMREMGLRAVSLCGGGEPFLHPRIADLLEGVRARDLRLGTITNATRIIGSQRLRDFVLYENTFLRVSIWPESNVPAVVRLSRMQRRTSLGARLTVSTKTLDWYLAILPRLLDGNFDYIEAKAERQSPHDPVLAPAEWVAEAEARLRAIAPDIRLLLAKQTPPAVQCYLTPVHVMIDALGDLILCCFFQDRKTEHTWGSIHDPRPFRELWEGAEHREARKGIDPAQCARWDCRFFKYHRQAEAVLGGGDVPTAGYFTDDDWFI